MEKLRKSLLIFSGDCGMELFPANISTQVFNTCNTFTAEIVINVFMVQTKKIKQIRKIIKYKVNVVYVNKMRDSGSTYEIYTFVLPSNLQCNR